jgi:hypothetical protein
VQKGLELARIQMPPSPAIVVITAGENLASDRAWSSLFGRMADPNVDSPVQKVEVDRFDRPRGLQAQQFLIEICVLHSGSLLRPIPRPTFAAALLPVPGQQRMLARGKGSRGGAFPTKDSMRLPTEIPEGPFVGAPIKSGRPMFEWFSEIIGSTLSFSALEDCNETRRTSSD